MNLLFVYFQRDESSRAEYERIVACAPEGMTVKPFGLQCPRLRWDALDLHWRTGERTLMEAYESLHEAAVGCDVLLHYNGWSLHPDFIKQLPTFNVYSFVDDPESSQKQSRYVAPSFDAVMYGNIASGPQYASWGCRRIAHIPIFIDPASVPAQEEAKASLSHDRDNDIVLCCGMTHWRKRRLAGLMSAFPSARVHGNGWEGGWISDEQQRDLYRRSRIGWNIHNSTGPINQRMFMLPGWGIMQICDNKTGLGQLFELGKEAIGFDTIPEAIELTKHFLEHDEERRHIARSGLERFHREYHPQQIWIRIEQQLQLWLDDRDVKPTENQTHVELRLLRSRRLVPALPRTAVRWLMKQRNSVIKSLERIRYGHVATDIDESIYLGQRRQYNPDRPFRSAKLRRSGLMRGYEENAHHLESMCWAINCLIGPAKTILATGSHAAMFAHLASIDPARTVNVNEEPAGNEAEPPLTHDLYVCTEVSFDPDTFEAFLLKAARIANRAIFCLRGKRVSDTPVCELVYDMLSSLCDRVELDFMPDPFVPWLEPLKGEAKTSPLIADCHFHREDA